MQRPHVPQPREHEAWDLLERCLRAHPEGPPHRAAITPAEIRAWMAEGDPAWFDRDAWWFPLSGEGDRDMPSGYYIIVPLDGSACGGAIVN